MKSWSLVLGAAVVVSGCGATLKELRQSPPQAKTSDREPACVYARIQRAAMEEQTCDICAQLVWTGNWDPTMNEGIVYAHVTYYEFFPIMFTIRGEGHETVIEKRVPSHYLSRYGEIAERIFTGTDYSRCPVTKPPAPAQTL